MVLPAVIVILCFAVFPLIISAYLALSRFALAPGGFTLKFVGILNFKKLLTGSQQYHLLGTWGTLGALHWLVLALGAAALLSWLARYFLSGRAGILGTLGRLVTVSVLYALLLVSIVTFAPGGVPGTLVNTLLYVVLGVSVQFLLGLGLALLCAQPIRGRNFFRVLFFVPLMVTPVGIAYAFRMLADMQKGPFAPLLRAFGASEWSWATEAWSARMMVMIGDTWQWTPVHLHRAARRGREPAARPGRGGEARRRQRLADLPRHHLARHRAGRRHRRPHPADRGLQDRRPAQRADRRRPRPRHRVR